MKNIFAEAVIGFYLCYPRRRKSNEIIFCSFLRYQKMAAVIQVSCSEHLHLHLCFIKSVKSFRVSHQLFEKKIEPN